MSVDSKIDRIIKIIETELEDAKQDEREASTFPHRTRIGIGHNVDQDAQSCDCHCKRSGVRGYFMNELAHLAMVLSHTPSDDRIPETLRALASENAKLRRALLSSVMWENKCDNGACAEGQPCECRLTVERYLA